MKKKKNKNRDETYVTNVMLEESRAKNPEERKQVLLEMMKDPQYKPLKIKEIMILLGIPSEDRGILEDLLTELMIAGKIIRSKKGKYALPNTYNLVVGTFTGHPKEFGFVSLDEEGKKDIFIPAYAVNGAMHRDRVLCSITAPAMGDKRQEGEIVEILQRGTEGIVGIYQECDNFGFVLPDDSKYPNDIFIPKRFNKGAVSGHKVVAKITNWEDDNKNPEGEIITILGHINDPGVDILSIIYQYNLPQEFPEEVMKEVENIPSEVSEQDKKGRRDLRGIQMVTIDGEDAKDLDDAVSLVKLDNGYYKLGVHIADVTHYVKEKSPLDREAYERGTSVYLVDRVIPMLPHKLSNGICSLNPHVDRLALSCIMTIDTEGNVQDHEIVETVINTDERMTYTNVKKILLDEDEDGTLTERYQDLIPMFKNMEELAMILRKKRMKRGAIDFDFPETKMILDKAGHPMEIKPYDRNVATRIIEEFMLVCNETIAEDYFWQEKPFIYRTHENPDPEKILALTEFINTFGYHMKGTRVHSKDMQKVLDAIAGKPEENVISHVLLRSLKQARYTPDCNGHFGLAAKYYCHFTSPIRRYPDLQIHRIIKYNLHHELQGKKEAQFYERMPDVARQSSLRERRAEEAERETVKLKKAEYMEQFIGKTFEGIITGITAWGCYVELSNTVEGLVHVNTMHDDYYIYDEVSQSLVGEGRGKAYHLGETVWVKVIDTNTLLRTIDFKFSTERDYLIDNGLFSVDSINAVSFNDTFLPDPY